MEHRAKSMESGVSRARLDAPDQARFFSLPYTPLGSLFTGYLFRVLYSFGTNDLTQEFFKHSIVILLIYFFSKIFKGFVSCRQWEFPKVTQCISFMENELMYQKFKNETSLR